MATNEQDERRKLTIQLHRILLLLDDNIIPMPFIQERLMKLLKEGEQVTVITTHDLQIDIINWTVRRAGKLIKLSNLEFRALLYMARRTGTSVSKNELLSEVWGYNGNPMTHTVETHIFRIRQKIDKGHSVKLLINDRGRGYMLIGNSPPL